MDDKKIKNIPDNTDNTEKKLTDEAKKQQAQFGSTQTDDINKNLGNFTNTMHSAKQNVASQIQLDADKKVIEKASKEHINFDRFSHTKRPSKFLKNRSNKFNEKIGLFLRNKNSLTIIWCIELAIMTTIIIIASLVIAKLYPVYTRYRDEGPIIAHNWYNLAHCGTVFCWIAIFPCAIPLIYLLTAWFIGINQVTSSKLYHYMFWVCLGISLICLIVGLSCDALPLIHLHWWGGNA